LFVAVGFPVLNECCFFLAQHGPKVVCADNKFSFPMFYEEVFLP
jgi:hypothetical protein